MKRIELLIGIPWTGKSTYLSEVTNTNLNIFVLSSDEIRKDLTGTYRDQTKNQEVFDELFLRLENLLNTHDEIHVIIDATSKTRKDRSRFFQIAKKHKAFVDATVFIAHPEVAYERDKLRVSNDKDVWLEVIRRSFSKLVLPYDTDERFATVNYINTGMEYINTEIKEQCVLIKNILENRNTNDVHALFSRTFEWKNKIDMYHYSEFHKETVRVHMENVVNQALSRNMNDTVLLATIFHDFGKYYTKAFNIEFQRYTFERHANISVVLFDLYYRDILEKMLPDVDLELVKNIVLNHNDYDRVYRKISKDTDTNIDFVWRVQRYYDEYKRKTKFSQKYYEYLFSHWICDKYGSEKDEWLMNEVEDYEIVLQKIIFQ